MDPDPFGSAALPASYPALLFFPPVEPKLSLHVWYGAGNIPMFPRDLADGLFSLHLGQPTAALSVHMLLNSDGSLAECGMVASTVHPTRKLTYHEVDELLDATMPEQEPMLWALHQVNTCDCSTTTAGGCRPVLRGKSQYSE